MGITSSFQKYMAMPSAVISDGLLTVPMWAVTQMSLTSAFHLPPIGTAGARSVVPVSDDTIALSGLLVGAERYAWKFALDTMAEASKRGSALAIYSKGEVGGLILVTSMTIRTDMQVKSLKFTASSAKRDTLDVAIEMMHLPTPGVLSTLLDMASIGIGALADAGGN